VSDASGTMETVSDQLIGRLAAGDAKAMAAEYGLRRIGVRPRLGVYLHDLWTRRHFIRVLAISTAYARNQKNYLGQLWAVLNPLLNAVVYFLIFGVLLQTDRGIENFVAFLTIGVFMFGFSASAITVGSKAIIGNLGLVRSLHFPRAVLPLAVVLTELIELLPALVVMCGIVLLTGEPITVDWLLFPIVVLLQWMFNTGCVLIAVRLVAWVRDLLNLIPLGLRFLRYASGVFFSISAYVGDNWLGAVMEYQPLAVYLTLARSALMSEGTPDPIAWAFGIGWAVLFLVGGFLLFWQAEERYGRD
jgi:teichoic acid transport system permease protein